MNKLHKLQICNLVSKLEKNIGNLFFIFAFFSVQRFLFPEISTIICLLPFILYVVLRFNNKTQLALSSLVISLILVVDNGSNLYQETSTYIRYVIYICVIFELFNQNTYKIIVNNLKLLIILIIILVFSTIIASFESNFVTNIDITIRTILVLIILTAFIYQNKNKNLEKSYLFDCGLGYIFGELINALVFFDPNEYLSYNSTKVFVILPLLIVIFSKYNFFVKLLIIFITIYIVNKYGSRMITLSSILLIFSTIIYINIKKQNFIRLIIAFSIAGLIQIILVNFQDFITVNKSFKYLIEILNSNSIAEIFSSLDVTRYAEHQLFFDRPILNILLGNGLYSGLVDNNQYLAFVTKSMTAFTDIEIDLQEYYKLHDFWTYYGLIFGVIPITIFLYKTIVLNIIRDNFIFSIFFGLLLFNACFSTAGVLLAAAFYKFYRA